MAKAVSINKLEAMLNAIHEREAVLICEGLARRDSQSSGGLNPTHDSGAASFMITGML